jgi:hypothetical protein
MVLQWCYNGVTIVLQRCYNGVTAVLQRCYNGVTAVLQRCYNGVTMVLQRCYNGVTSHSPSSSASQSSGCDAAGSGMSLGAFSAHPWEDRVLESNDCGVTRGEDMVLESNGYGVTE